MRLAVLSAEIDVGVRVRLLDAPGGSVYLVARTTGGAWSLAATPRSGAAS